jgi:hypothetical protein
MRERHGLLLIVRSGQVRLPVPVLYVYELLAVDTGHDAQLLSLAYELLPFSRIIAGFAGPCLASLKLLFVLLPLAIITP